MTQTFGLRTQGLRSIVDLLLRFALVTAQVNISRWALVDRSPRLTCKDTERLHVLQSMPEGETPPPLKNTTVEEARVSEKAGCRKTGSCLNEWADCNHQEPEVQSTCWSLGVVNERHYVIFASPGWRFTRGWWYNHSSKDCQSAHRRACQTCRKRKEIISTTGPLQEVAEALKPSLLVGARSQG